MYLLCRGQEFVTLFKRVALVILIEQNLFNCCLHAQSIYLFLIYLYLIYLNNKAGIHKILLKHVYFSSEYSI